MRLDFVPKHNPTFEGRKISPQRNLMVGWRGFVGTAFGRDAFELNNSDGFQRASITIPAGFAPLNHTYLSKEHGGIGGGDSWLSGAEQSVTLMELCSAIGVR